MKTPPDRDTLVDIVGKLEDPVADLVRKDSQFKKLELDEADFVDADPVVDLLVKYPRLLQRPIVVTDEKAIIGRPKDRVRELLAP